MSKRCTECGARSQPGDTDPICQKCRALRRAGITIAKEHAPVPAEPETDWEREQRFWREHPIDRFDMVERGAWNTYYEAEKNEIGDWIRAEDHRKAIEAIEVRHAAARAREASESDDYAILDEDGEIALNECGDWESVP